MKRTQKYIAIIALVLGAIQAAGAQADTLHLTLRDCIRMAQEQGPLGAIALHQYEARNRATHYSRAGYLPQSSLQGDVPGYDRLSIRSSSPMVRPSSRRSGRRARR